MNDLIKAVSSNYGQSKVLNSTKVQQALKNEAEKLRGCIKARLDDYYTSTAALRSGLYERTEGLLNSLEVSESLQVVLDPTTWEIKIYFNDGSKSHSMFGNQGEVSKLDLINFGWSVGANVPFSNVPNFGYFEGVHFVEAGIEDYIKNKPDNIKVTFDGKTY